MEKLKNILEFVVKNNSNNNFYDEESLFMKIMVEDRSHSLEEIYLSFNHFFIENTIQLSNFSNEVLYNIVYKKFILLKSVLTISKYFNTEKYFDINFIIKDGNPFIEVSKIIGLSNNFKELSEHIPNKLIRLIIDNKNNVLLKRNNKELFVNIEFIISFLMFTINKSQKTYIIKDKKNNKYKIGKSKHLRFREKTLRSEEPDCEIILYNNMDIETPLHRFFKDKRHRGEWFNLNDNDIKMLISKFNFKPIC